MPRTEVKLMSGWEFALDDANEEQFKPVTLPHDWAIEAPIRKDMGEGPAQGFRDRYHLGWYRRTLQIDKKRSCYNYYLDFGGIFENSTIWMNNKEVGGRKYGYSSFRVDVTDALIEGTNIIQVKVDNTTMPVDRWYSGAGIYRTVKFIEVEALHLCEDDIVVHTELSEEQAVVTVDCNIPAAVRVALLETGNSAEGLQGKTALTVERPALWSAETPNLYHLKISLLDDGKEADTIVMPIGIRKLELVSGKGLYVNGEPIKLKGVCLHQDIACRGNGVRKELWRERLQALKKMGCNAIRTAHHTFAPEFLDLCDEMGFYVYEECFDKWTGGLYGKYYATEWKRDIDAMVKRDRNRPCIIIWGVGNEVENQGQASMLDLLKQFTDYVRLLDSTRPVTYAMNPHFKQESNIDVRTIEDIQKFVDEADEMEIFDPEERIQRIRRIAEYVDIISCNYQEQWYEQIHAAIPDQLILGTEVYQYFKGNREQLQNFTQENPALVPEEYDYVIGSMIWTAFDYLGESMGYPSKGWSGACIRTNGIKKAGYYILQSYWQEEPMVHFSVMDYSLGDEGIKEHWDLPPYADHWHFPQFQRMVVPYMIASNCDEVALFVNEKQYFVPKPEYNPSRIIQGFLPYQPGVVTVVGYRNKKEVCRHVTTTPGPAVKLAFTKEKQQVAAESGYEMLLTVRAEDIAGNHYFRESSKVRFRLEGEGKILAVDNGDLTSNESYQDCFIHMHHGYASVLVRFSGIPGRVVVYADADGMKSGKTVIDVEGLSIRDAAVITAGGGES